MVTLNIGLLPPLHFQFRKNTTADGPAKLSGKAEKKRCSRLQGQSRSYSRKRIKLLGDSLMRNSTPKVAVVGCGYWGKNLVRNFHELGSLLAICDVDNFRCRETAENYGVLSVDNFEDLLALSEVQGIVIAAPAAQHFELAKRALLAGKDAFVEKPIALHVDEGQELARLATELGRVLMVGHLLLYHPAIAELSRLIKAGELGKIQYVHSSRLNWGKFRTEENILWSFAPHDISAILFLLGEDPARVSAHGASYLSPRTTDVTLSTLEFASGVMAHIFVSWLHPFKEQRLVVVGNQKLAVFDDAEKTHKLCLYPHRIDWIDRLPVARKVEAEVVPLPPDEPLRLECQHFLECIEQRKTPATDSHSALRVLRILEACEKSLRDSSEPVDVGMQANKYSVHPTAVIDPPCEIGDGTRIWHFSHIMRKSVIGKNCNLGQNIHIASGVHIGNNVKIQNNVSVYEGVELQDDVFCGPSAVFTNVINPRSHVNRKSEYRKTLVKRGASLGANSTIICGVTIGEYAFVAAGAVVTRDIPDHALVMGVPARQVGWICRCGWRLQLSDQHATCSKCGEQYRLDGGLLSNELYTATSRFLPRRLPLNGDSSPVPSQIVKCFGNESVEANRLRLRNHE
jgi:UDP-2-acetamido-3-amino-2,3-dideoxy-glucuronate N-acetyltransferase